MRTGLLVAVLPVLLAAGPSCAVDPVVLATLPAEEEGGTTVGCAGAGDCDPYPNTYCQKSSCSPLSTGVCVPSLLQTTSEYRPVCGCDGITYFNDSLRQASGVAAGTPDPCLFGAATCAVAGDCPDGALGAAFLIECGRQQQHCGPNPSSLGICWVLPLIPPPRTGRDAFDACEPGGARCVDLWTAISTQEPFGRAHPSPMCP
jgi:hypothetical protein